MSFGQDEAYAEVIHEQQNGDDSRTGGAVQTHISATEQKEGAQFQPSSAMQDEGTNPPPPDRPSTPELLLAACRKECVNSTIGEYGSYQYLVAKLEQADGGKLSAGRFIKVLDALALICVSDKGQSVAVGLELKPETELVLWFTESHIKSAQATGDKDPVKDHLGNVLELLRELRRKVRSEVGEKTPDDVEKDSLTKLVIAVYGYCRRRLFAYIEKAGMIQLDERIRSAVDQGMFIGSEKRQHEFLERLMHIFDEFEDENERLLRIIPYLQEASDILQIMHKRERETDELHFLTALNKYGEPQEYRRLVRKLLAIHRSIEQLLLLTRSSSTGHVLDEGCKIEIKRVAPEYRNLSYDFENDVKFLADIDKPGYPFGGKDAFAQTIRALDTEEIAKPEHERQYFGFARFCGSIALHAEARLLAYFVDKGIRAYNYIGVSKRCCPGCVLLFRAYRDAIRGQTCPTNVPYYVRGILNRPSPWLLPSANWPDGTTDYFRREVLDFVQSKLRAKNDEHSKGSVSPIRSITIVFRRYLTWELPRQPCER